MNAPDEDLRYDVEATVFHIPRSQYASRTEPGGPMRAEVLGGPMDGLRNRVRGDTLEIGRAHENDLCLPMDPGVSSRHARIVREGRSFWLEDLDSRNGTFLGDERLRERVPISPGSTFTVGRTHVQFMPR